MEIIIILLNQSIGGNNARTCWEEILAINKTHKAIIQCSLPVLVVRPRPSWVDKTKLKRRDLGQDGYVARVDLRHRLHISSSLLADKIGCWMVR